MWGIGKKLSVVTTYVLFRNDCIRLWQITWKHEWSRYLIPMSDECVTASTVECSLCFCPPRKSKTHHQRIYVFNFSLSHLHRDLTDTQRQTLRFYLWSCDEQTHSHIFKLYTHINRHTHFIRIRSGLMWPHTYTSVYCFFCKRSHCKGNRMISNSLMPSPVPTLDLSCLRVFPLSPLAASQPCIMQL